MNTTAKHTVRKTVVAALFTALVCVATTVIKIPSSLTGYLNLGDCTVLLCAWMLGPVYGFAAAGLGSALADLLGGYFIYVPVTFVVKGSMALAAAGLFALLERKTGDLPARIIGGIAAETVMVLGYFAFEGFMYGFGASAANIFGNILQGAAGLVIGIMLMKISQKARLSLANRNN